MISMEGAQLTKAVFSGGLNHRKRKIRSDVANWLHGHASIPRTGV